MSVFDHPDFDDHQQVVFCHDKSVGLRAIIAVHNTNLGPALGGCRMWAYENDADAITDVLRLSKGMTYKAAMAGLSLGGGKAVIIGDPKKDKTKDLMHSFGRFIDQLNGRYITAEDVGTTVADMDAIRSVTLHVSGVTGGAGNPSPSTAHGVFVGIEAAVRHKLCKDSVKSLKIAVQGLGNVGYGLCRYLHEAGAKMIVADINKEAVARAVEEFGAVEVGTDDIQGVDADVFAPCALGAAINDETIPQLRVSIVAGAANNQLAEERHGAVLAERGILYAPDYVNNAGGLIDVARFKIDMDIEEARRKLQRIDDTLTEIFQRADKENKPTNEIADRIAEERFRRT
ncbi:MAG: Glu/Leu/Phe/Val dehydrogenase [Alphaproteobacteria bacterium]|nr:Glu/Leu/Phe/Val dehydrogenase [Alphaproteobacteria bacterium]